jgi:hypothetical protein
VISEYPITRLQVADAIAARLDGAHQCPDCFTSGLGELCTSCKWLRLQSQIAFDNRNFEAWGAVPTKRVWQAVIEQAVQDYASVATGIEEEQNRESATYFLFKDDQTLQVICRLAGYDMNWIQRNCEKLEPMSLRGKKRREWNG